MPFWDQHEEPTRSELIFGATKVVRTVRTGTPDDPFRDEETLEYHAMPIVRQPRVLNPANYWRKPFIWALFWPAATFYTTAALIFLALPINPLFYVLLIAGHPFSSPWYWGLVIALGALAWYGNGTPIVRRHRELFADPMKMSLEQKVAAWKELESLARGR